MPQLDSSSFISQIFWLTVTFLTLWFVMSLFVIPRIAEIIDERRQKIETNIQKAERLNKQAMLSLERYEQSIEQAKKDIDDRISAEKEQLEASFELKKAEVNQYLNQKIADNETIIKKEREETLKEVHRISEDIAELILQKLGIAQNDKS